MYTRNRKERTKLRESKLCILKIASSLVLYATQFLVVVKVYVRTTGIGKFVYVHVSICVRALVYYIRTYVNR